MSSRTTVTTPPPTAQETALTARQVELATFQLDELRRQRTQQEQFATELEPLFAAQAAEAERATARAEQIEPLQDELLQLALEDLRRGGAASPEQIALIEEATGAALETGTTDIERFETEGLERLREELAPSLGLRPSDTPVLDRGARLAAESARQKGQLSTSLRTAGANARLNFPLASSQLLQGVNQGQQNILESTRQFQEQLRQAAILNRLQIADVSSGIGARLAGNPGATLSSAINPLTQARLANTTQRTSGFGLAQIGQLASGTGAVISAFRNPSSRDIKEDKAAVDEDEVLAEVERLPVESWRYKPGFGLSGERHVGPYAEDFKEGFGLGDGKSIPIVDAVGVSLAATKALSKKVDRLIEHVDRRDSGFGLAA